MNYRPKVLVGVLVMIATLAISESSFAKDTATITIRDGTVFEDASFTVYQQYKVVTIKLAAGEKSISFADIRSIVDADGNDITAKSLGRVYTGRQETWLEKDSEIIRRAEKKLWKLGLQFGSNLSLSGGNYYDGFDAGVGFGGRFKVPVSHQLALNLQISKSGITLNESDNTVYSINQNYSLIYQRLKISAFQYSIEIEYFRRYDRVTPGKTIWYMYAGFGAIIHMASLDLRVRDNTNGQILYIKEDTTKTNAIQTLGVGIIQLLTEQVGLDFSLNVDIVYVRSKADGRIGSGTIFDLRVGLIYLIK